MWRLKVKRAKCPKCKSPLVALYDIVFPEYKNIRYGKMRIHRERDVSCNWRPVSCGFACSNRKCTHKVLHRPQLGFTEKQLRERMVYSTYKVANTDLFEYAVKFLRQDPEPANLVESFSGILHTFTPKLRVKKGFLQNFEQKVVRPEYVIVSKTKEGLTRGLGDLFLVRAEEFAKWRRRESFNIIDLSNPNN